MSAPESCLSIRAPKTSNSCAEVCQPAPDASASDAADRTIIRKQLSQLPVHVAVQIGIPITVMRAAIIPGASI